MDQNKGTSEAFEAKMSMHVRTVILPTWLAAQALSRLFSVNNLHRTRVSSGNRVVTSVGVGIGVVRGVVRVLFLTHLPHLSSGCPSRDVFWSKS